ncbi:MAG: 30S ribosomal protein S1 [Cyclobacteriaceae bacterium]|nr:30S ribosomal protein S1 [Cyclobacteriaceae bacterium]
MTKPKETKPKAKPETDELKPVAKKASKVDVEIELDEEDELAEFKKEKRAEELGEIETARIINKVADRMSSTSSPVSLEDFDWDAFDRKGFGEGYSAKDREELTNMYSGTVTSVNESEVVEGIVVGINDKDVILNIGFKSDGLVPVAEFKDLPDLKIGDKVDLFIEERENAMGQLVLSRRKAKLVKGWENIQKAFDEDLVIEGFVKRRTKGGLIVDVYGIEAFLPGSQIDVKPIRDFDIYVNKSIEVKVVKINYSNDNVVVSHKVLIEKDLEQQKAVILNNLEKGQVLEGVIKNMTNFGVFIDLGGVDGLLHITDISWGRINHPDELLKLDQVVKVVVLDFDEDKKRISLGMKQLTAHPWDSLPADIIIGSKVKGKIVNVADYGAFLEIQPGVEGLIHVSEMSWSQHLRNPQDFIKVGEELEAVVLTIDRDERKMSLGIKQLTEDPWTRQDVMTKYAINTKHKGVVRNLTNFGLFIELEEGIDGLVHVSDLSWTRKIKHPSEFIKVGESLEVVVLELDAANRRLALSHKHLEENPWDAFESVFQVGTVHKCTVITKTDKGGILELPYGIEGFCSAKNLVREDESKIEAGEALDFKVIEFSKDDRRIALSHKAMWSKEEEKVVTPAKKRAPSKGKAIDKINKEAEKSTLGDIEALSALKDKMNADKTKGSAE